MFVDPDWPTSADADEYDFLTFDERDLVDARTEQDFRTLTTGLPARPGTRRG